jgi:hypothetical protein
MAGTGRVWIISRYGWEYDDSRYYRPESDSGYPVSAFTFPEIAKKLCDEKNVAEMRSMGIGGLDEYVEGYNYPSSEEEYSLFLEAHFLDDDLSFTKPLSEISDQILVEVMDYFHLAFYEVIEVELLA